jgi:cyclopropane fatty-acyl-phospholipid synthase-like methyltransferase
MDYLLNLAENYSIRVNVLYGAGIISFVHAYWYSFLSGAGISSFLFHFLCSVFFFALIAALVVFGFGAFMYLYSWNASAANDKADWEKYIVCKDEQIQREWQGKKIPMETFLESYLAGKCDFKNDLHETLRKHRNEIFRFVFTQGHLNFFYKKFILQTFGHTIKEDAVDVKGTYNLGNDFYNAFLGNSMVYTCAVFNNVDPSKESLEEAQRNKIDFVCKKIELKKGERHLDIGCGWGTFVLHAAKNYGSNSYGITIAKEQIEWGQKQIARLDSDVQKRAKVELRDYRDLPSDQKYNKITCLEMAEHVGVKNFQTFCRQLYGLLEDDGVLYIQMCGLRPRWTFEDLVWGLFMAKYIFPGADASCPAAWVAHQFENAGFEIHSVETVTQHYAMTIKKWYDNWVANKEKIVIKYGELEYRKYLLFLGWSVIIANQGTSGCYQIVAHKNLDSFNRAQFIGKVGVPSPFTGESEPLTTIPENAFSD